MESSHQYRVEDFCLKSFVIMKFCDSIARTESSLNSLVLVSFHTQSQRLYVNYIISFITNKLTNLSYLWHKLPVMNTNFEIEKGHNSVS